MLPLTAATMLDVDGAIGAAAAAGLARGLIQAAAPLVLIGMIGAALVRPHMSAEPGLIRRIPWHGVIVGAALVLVLGGLIGLMAAIRSASIVSDDGIIDTLASSVAVWSIAAIMLAALALFMAHRGRIPRGLSGLGALVVLIGVTTTAALPRPAEQVQATAQVTEMVQATIVVSPGAAGANDVRLGLSGPDADIAQLRAAVVDGDATVSFRSLALDVTSPEAPLTVDDEGAFVATDVVLDGDGRWRAQYQLGTLDEPIVADMTMQPNPGHNP